MKTTASITRPSAIASSTSSQHGSATDSLAANSTKSITPKHKIGDVVIDLLTLKKCAIIECRLIAAFRYNLVSKHLVWTTAAYNLRPQRESQVLTGRHDSDLN